MAGNTRAAADPSLLDISTDLAVYCNIGSLTKRLQEVREYLGMYKFPILALSETLIAEKIPTLTNVLKALETLNLL